MSVSSGALALLEPEGGAVGDAVEFRCRHPHEFERRAAEDQGEVDCGVEASFSRTGRRKIEPHSARAEFSAGASLAQILLANFRERADPYTGVFPDRN